MEFDSNQKYRPHQDMDKSVTSVAWRVDVPDPKLVNTDPKSFIRPREYYLLMCLLISIWRKIRIDLNHEEKLRIFANDVMTEIMSYIEMIPRRFGEFILAGEDVALFLVKKFDINNTAAEIMKAGRPELFFRFEKMYDYIDAVVFSDNMFSGQKINYEWVQSPGNGVIKRGFKVDIEPFTGRKEYLYIFLNTDMVHTTVLFNLNGHLFPIHRNWSAIGSQVRHVRMKLENSRNDLAQRLANCDNLFQRYVMKSLMKDNEPTDITHWMYINKDVRDMLIGIEKKNVEADIPIMDWDELAKYNMCWYFEPSSGYVGVYKGGIHSEQRLVSEKVILMTSDIPRRQFEAQKHLMTIDDGFSTGKGNFMEGKLITAQIEIARHDNIPQVGSVMFHSTMKTDNSDFRILHDAEFGGIEKYPHHDDKIFEDKMERCSNMSPGHIFGKYMQVVGNTFHHKWTGDMHYDVTRGNEVAFTWSQIIRVQAEVINQKSEWERMSEDQKKKNKRRHCENGNIDHDDIGSYSLSEIKLSLLVFKTICKEMDLNFFTEFYTAEKSRTTFSGLDKIDEWLLVTVFHKMPRFPMFLSLAYVGDSILTCEVAQACFDARLTGQEYQDKRAYHTTNRNLAMIFDDLTSSISKEIGPLPKTETGAPGEKLVGGCVEALIGFINSCFGRIAAGEFCRRLLNRSGLNIKRKTLLINM